MTETPAPIDWGEVAYVAFDGDRPCILSSADPKVIFDTLCSLLDDDRDDRDDPWGEAETNLAEVRQRIGELRWELHPVEQAKEVFCCRPKAAEPTLF